MEIIDNLYLAFLISFTLFAWTETDFFVEYCKLFGIWDIFKVGEYEDYKDHGDDSAESLGFGSPTETAVDISYLNYLLLKHDSFFVRLITCPICLGVWLNIFTLFISRNFSSFTINIWLSLFLYFIIKIVMKKSDG
jgi:hypothetical protein